MHALPTLRSSCRPGATAKLEDLMIGWLKERAQELVSADPSEHSSEDLQSCQKHLTFFCTDGDIAANLKDTRSALEDKIAEAVANEDYSSLLDPTFISHLDSCKGHEVALKEHFQTIEKGLHKALIDSCTNLGTEEGSTTVMNIANNMAALGDQIQPLVAGSVVKTLLEKATAFAEGHRKYLGGANKTNINHFNKVALAYGSWKLGVQHQSDEAKDILRAVISSLANAKIAHKQLQETKANEATEGLRATLSELVPFCHGQRDGSSWKEGLGADSTFKQIVAVAMVPKTGLLAGPGKKVASTKSTLDEARHVRQALLVLHDCLEFVSLFLHFCLSHMS
jgi:hypothetical protein